MTKPKTGTRTRGRPTENGVARTRRVHLRGTEEQVAAWQKAAKLDGKTLSSWGAKALDEITKKRG